MLLVKGTEVEFILRDGREVVAPKKYGMMGNVSGGAVMLPRNAILVGPFRDLGSADQETVSAEARKYLGRTYAVKAGYADLPDRQARFTTDGWTLLGDVGRVYYLRRGAIRVYRNGKPRLSVHDFATRQFFVVPVKSLLYRKGSWLRLQLPATARLNERGFLSP